MHDKHLNYLLMTCPKCGAQNMNGVTFCGSCGAQMAFSAPPPPVETPMETPASANYNQQQAFQKPPQQQQPYYTNTSLPSGGPAYDGGFVPPKSYMTESIIVTVVSLLCCCSPISIILGIIAIVKANNVNTEFSNGNIIEANRNADAAKKLTLWAAIITVVFSIITCILVFVIMGMGFSELGDFSELFNL